MTIRTTPATADRWDDVVAAFGRRGDDPGWCWCQRFLEPPESCAPVDNRAALHREVTTSSVPPGIVAYVDGVPAGWTRVMPRKDIAGVARNRALQRILDDQPTVWWITCFAVDTDALLAQRVSGSALFTGTMRTFTAAGFHEIGRTYPSRPVMRRDL